MKTPTKEQVAAEVAALKKLKPFGQFASKTTRTISTLIEALEDGYDDTSEEWEELGDELQDAVYGALGWKNGTMKDRPSSGWEGLAK